MRIVIADDSVVIRAGVTRLLEEAGHEVVATAADLPGLLRETQLAAPDAVVIDIRMPPTNTSEGIDAARRIARLKPGTGVLVLSQYLESSYAIDLLEQTPTHIGYLLKDHLAADSTLADAVARVASGECVVDPAIVDLLVQHPRARGPLAALTAREVEVLSYLAEGLGNSAIADRLEVSLRTLESHIRMIFIKLGISETTDKDKRVLAVLTYLRACASSGS